LADAVQRVRQALGVLVELVVQRSELSGRLSGPIRTEQW
jgi:hypothetical protein